MQLTCPLFKFKVIPDRVHFGAMKARASSFLLAFPLAYFPLTRFLLACCSWFAAVLARLVLTHKSVYTAAHNP